MKVMFKKRAVYFVIAAKIVVVAVLLTDSGCKREKEDKDTFSVAFMTDIHLQPERNAVAGFTMSLDTVNIMNPDFILTGGDLIMDALGQRYGRADSLYNLYQEVVKKAAMPVHNTMGNHEIYGIYRKSGADPANPEYGEKMYEKRIGPLYYSFLHKGWKFMVINSIEDTGKDSYTALVDSVQMAWIKEELKNTDPETPIVISTHIPFVSAMTQVLGGSTVPNDSSLVVYNSKEVVAQFKDHNLRLVLQGHLHVLEEININGVQYITSGAVCGAWWNGPYNWSEEGFLYLTFVKNDFTWRYVDYGWKVN
jgi:predicted MPP superfamily phosphohydrolase